MYYSILVLLDLAKSFFQISRFILFGKSVDVVFYYPQHFNRSSLGDNPYFTPIIQVCDEHKLKYIVLEEPDRGTSNPRNKKSIKADFLFWAIIILRKLYHILNKKESYVKIDKRVARILDIATFHKLRANSYITISNSMVDILAELNPKGIVYDYQHGLICRTNPGYFKDIGILTESYTKENRHLLLWGSLYKNAFEDIPLSDSIHSRLEIVGYPIRIEKKEVKNSEKKSIVISLQFVAKENIDNQHMLEMLENCLRVLSYSGYNVYLKHHPRFNNAIDLDWIIQKYPFAQFTSKSLSELVLSTKLHITWFSTTCFEYANYGIPTFFLIDSIFIQGIDIFYDEYKYPLYDGMTLDKVLMRINDNDTYKADCLKVLNWYKNAYAPFNPNLMLEILSRVR